MPTSSAAAYIADWRTRSGMHVLDIHGLFDGGKQPTLLQVCCSLYAIDIPTLTRGSPRRNRAHLVQFCFLKSNALAKVVRELVCCLWGREPETRMSCPYLQIGDGCLVKLIGNEGVQSGVDCCGVLCGVLWGAVCCVCVWPGFRESRSEVADLSRDLLLLFFRR